MSEEKPFDEDGRIDYHRWLQVNQFVRKMHQMQLIADQQAWLERRNEMLLDLDMIDKVVDMMDDYPEAEYIINKIMRRLDNDKKY
jgi:hypothetical protein